MSDIYLYEIHYYWSEHWTTSHEKVVYRSLNEKEARDWYWKFAPKRSNEMSYTVIIPLKKTLIKTLIGEAKDETELEQHSLEKN